MKKVASLLLATSMFCCGANSFSFKLLGIKISTDLLTSAPNSSDGRYRVIIQWAPGATGTADKIVGLGGTVRSEFSRLKAGTYLVPQLALGMLAKDPDVKYMSVDRKVRRKLANAVAAIGAPAVWKSGYTGSGVGVAIIDSGLNPDPNLPRIAYAEDFVSPESVPSNRGLVGGLVSSVLSGSKVTGPDWYGHGQHIAGIIASNGNDSKCLTCKTKFTGVAPGVSLINLRVLDGLGEGNESDVIAAIERAIELKSKYNIRVINMSLGRPVFESYKNDPLCQEVEAAWKAGIVVVVSAGNEGRDNSFGNNGYGTILSPGNDPYVITVGAMKSMGTPDIADDLIASYSSKGPSAVDHIVKPDILAPGNQITSLRAKTSRMPLEVPLNIALLSSYKTYYGSAYPANQPDAPSDSATQPADARIGIGYSPTYFALSGTSMAAGVVSGAVADLLQAKPSLTPDQVKMLVMKTANKVFPDSSAVTDADTGETFTSYYDIFTVGAGYLNLAAALAEINKVPSGVTALSPTATFDQNSGDVTLVFDPSSIFSDRAMWGADSVDSQRAMWGSRSMWGANVLDGESAKWGARAKWGASSFDAQRAMWGASALWGERSMWGASSTTQSEAILANGEK